MKKILKFILPVIILAIVIIAKISISDNEALIVNRQSDPNLRVLVVAGHGEQINSSYQTAGKQSPTWENGLKIYEGISNKDLAENLVIKLKHAGIDAQIINPELRDISLQARINRINTIYSYDKRSIAIFLHHNAQAYNKTADYFDKQNLYGWTSAEIGGATGTEIFTSKGFTKADQIAKYIGNSISNQQSAISNLKFRGLKEANFFVLKYTSCPAALLEFGFMTTKVPDCMVISDSLHREIYLQSIVSGLKQYSNSISNQQLAINNQQLTINN
ncbi:MAG: N-acetylmuramoyl-L-alanine amidase [Bacteroidales bacterium]|jgi:N-acetylmuramoyl-L-alanine amidase|nr:N-acetylmuramoyl-L-alanine amidase [Bacteroidales bacterium]